MNTRDGRASRQLLRICKLSKRRLHAATVDHSGNSKPTRQNGLEKINASGKSRIHVSAPRVAAARIEFGPHQVSMKGHQATMSGSSDSLHRHGGTKLVRLGWNVPTYSAEHVTMEARAACTDYRVQAADNSKFSQSHWSEARLPLWKCAKSQKPTMPRGQRRRQRAGE